MTATFTRNAEHHGIEVSFPGRPDGETLSALKSAGFRWHNVRRVWYARENAERLALAERITGGADPAPEITAAPVKTAPTPSDLESIRQRYAGEITRDGSGRYAGFTGELGRGLYGQDLKKAILSALKENGFRATARAGRGSGSLTFTVKVPAEYIIPEEDYIREETAGAYVRGLYWYTTPDGGSIHRDYLPEDETERRAILEATARSAYETSYKTGGTEHVRPAFVDAVKAIVNAFNADHSDTMSDYFDRHFYDWYEFKAA